MSQTASVTVELLEEILDAFNRHDLDGIMEFFADDSVLLTPRGPGPWGQRFEGKDAVRRGLCARFEGMPDVHYGDDRHWVSGELGISEWTITGTTTDGEHIKARGCDHFTFRDGLVTVKNSFWKIVDK